MLERAPSSDKQHMPENRVTRRAVIKTLLVTSATSLVGGRVWAAKVVGELTANVVNPFVGVARIKLSEFEALGADGGSVRLGSSDVTQQGTFSDPDIRSRGLFPPILINRISSTQYLAFDASCLHAGCAVPALSGGLTGRIQCPCHGSVYDAFGKCIVGPAPVGQFLRSFPSRLEGEILHIETDQWFNMAQKLVLNDSEKRLQITWDSFEFVEYELRWRPNFASEAIPVNFATSLNGPLTESIITGNDNGALDAGAVKIYVVPQDGIYQVAIRLRSV
jgi:Rieske Fe-S protein